MGIANQVKLRSMAINDFRSVLGVLAEAKPDEVYNLAGQSSVGLSFDQPVETMESMTSGTLNLLEAIRFYNTAIRFYNASSSEWVRFKLMCRIKDPHPNPLPKGEGVTASSVRRYCSLSPRERVGVRVGFSTSL